MVGGMIAAGMMRIADADVLMASFSKDPLRRMGLEVRPAAVQEAGGRRAEEDGPSPSGLPKVYHQQRCSTTNSGTSSDGKRGFSQEKADMVFRRNAFYGSNRPDTRVRAVLPVCLDKIAIDMILRVPNLPFFYLVYRAWSHWRAISGGKHVQFLLKHSLLSYLPSPLLDKVYAAQRGPLPSSPKPTTPADVAPMQPPASLEAAAADHENGETMLLSQVNGKNMTQALELPELEVELERAVWQVETAIKTQNEKIAQEHNTEASKASDGPQVASEKPAESRKDR
jgi:hypothetical protein